MGVEPMQRYRFLLRIRPSAYSGLRPLPRSFAASGAEDSASSSSSSPAAKKSIDEANPYHGLGAIQGEALDTFAADQSDQTIEQRLQNRLSKKASSRMLEGNPSGTGMFGNVPKDLVEDRAAQFRVNGADDDHLEGFQDTLKKLRRTGRDGSGQRDPG